MPAKDCFRIANQMAISVDISQQLPYVLMMQLDGNLKVHDESMFCPYPATFCLYLETF
jgi:hypothetical protein